VGRSKRQNDIDIATLSVLRVCGLRDASLRSIKNLSALAEEAKINVELRASFEAHFLSFKWFVEQFETEQQGVLNAFVELDNVDELESVDAEVTDTMKE